MVQAADSFPSIGLISLSGDFLGTFDDGGSIWTIADLDDRHLPSQASIWTTAAQFNECRFGAGGSPRVSGFHEDCILVNLRRPLRLVSHPTFVYWGRQKGPRKREPPRMNAACSFSQVREGSSAGNRYVCPDCLGRRDPPLM